jgi:hypothetical protein
MPETPPLREIQGRDRIPCAVYFALANDYFDQDEPRSGAGGWFLGTRRRRGSEDENENDDSDDGGGAQRQRMPPVTVHFDDRSREVVQKSPNSLIDLREQLVDGTRCLVFHLPHPASQALSSSSSATAKRADVYCQLEPSQLAPGDLVYGRFQNGDNWYRGRVASVNSSSAPAFTSTSNERTTAASGSYCSIVYDDGDHETNVPFGDTHHGNVRKVMTPDPPYEWLDGLPIDLPSKKCRSSLSGVLQVNGGSGAVQIRYSDNNGNVFFEKRAVASIIDKVLTDALARAAKRSVDWPTQAAVKRALCSAKDGTAASKAPPPTTRDNARGNEEPAKQQGAMAPPPPARNATSQSAPPPGKRSVVRDSKVGNDLDVSDDLVLGKRPKREAAARTIAKNRVAAREPCSSDDDSDYSGDHTGGGLARGKRAKRESGAAASTNTTEKGAIDDADSVVAGMMPCGKRTNAKRGSAARTRPTQSVATRTHGSGDDDDDSDSSADKSLGPARGKRTKRHAAARIQPTKRDEEEEDSDLDSVSSGGDARGPATSKRTKRESAARAKPLNGAAAGKLAGGKYPSDGDSDATDADVVEVFVNTSPQGTRNVTQGKATAKNGLRRSNRAVTRPSTYGEGDEVNDGGTLGTETKERSMKNGRSNSIAKRQARPPTPQGQEPEGPRGSTSKSRKMAKAGGDGGDTGGDDEYDEVAIPEACVPYIPKMGTSISVSRGPCMALHPRELPLADAHNFVNALTSQSSKWTSDLGILVNCVNRLILPTEALERLVQLLLTGPTSNETPFPDVTIMEQCVLHLERYMTSGPDQVRTLTRCFFDHWEECLGRRLTFLEYCATGDEARLNSDAFLRRSESLHLNMCCGATFSKVLQYGICECIRSPDTRDSHQIVRSLQSHRNGLKGPLEMAVASAAHLWMQNGVFEVGDKNLTDLSPSLPPHLSPPSEALLRSTKQNVKSLLAALGDVCTYLAWLYGTEDRLPTVLVARVIVNSFLRALNQEINFDPTPFLSTNMTRLEYVTAIKLEFVMKLGKDLVPQLRPHVAQGLGITQVWNWIHQR